MVLKHRDKEVLRFDWVGPQSVRVVSVNEAARQFLPLEMQGEATDERLQGWLKHRAVPKQRAYVEQFLAALGIRSGDLRGIISFSRGLSLNDVYWVAADEDKAKWAKINLYANPFSETLAYMAFTGGDGSVEPGSTSPELTTNGMLAKCWRIVKGVPTLYKSGTEGAANCGFEPYSEFYAAQIAEALGFEHVAYRLAKYKGRLCSTCAAFTSNKVGYIPAGRFCTREAALADARFANIFFFDAIICNPDRHLGNFGYLVNNNTNKIVGAAPIFDNGYGLFALALYKNKYKDEFADLDAYAAGRAPALYSSWFDIPGGITNEMKARARRLRGFRFRLHPHYNLPLGRLRALEDFLQRRIDAIENGRVVRGKSCTIKNKNKLQIAEKKSAQFEEMIKVNLKADPFITAEELSRLLGVAPRTIFTRLKNLQVAGVVRRIGSRKTGHWEVVAPGAADLKEEHENG